MVEEKETKIVEAKETSTPTKKEAKKVTVSQIVKALDGTGITTVEKESGWTTIKKDKNICYVKDTKYGVSMWSIKQGKTIKVETLADVKEFTDAVKKSVKKE